MSRRFNTIHATEWLRGQFSGRLLTVLDRDGWRCRYCGVKLNRMTASMDHVMPKARGGKDHPGNLVACCKPCNKDKGDKTLGEWTPKIIPKFMRSRRAVNADGRVLDELRAMADE